MAGIPGAWLNFGRHFLPGIRSNEEQLHHMTPAVQTEANRSVSRPRRKKIALVVASSLFVIGCLLALRGLLGNHIEIRGTISSRDLRTITGMHSSHCSVAWPGLQWFPDPIRNLVIARLNPIEIVSVPKDGMAIVVYRGFDTYYYDKRGKHRWGTSSYTLVKDSKGWH